MAGIGFNLRKLSHQDSLGSPLLAFFHSMLVVCGPWLTAVVAMSLLRLVYVMQGHSVDIESFQLITMYNFTFSIVLTSPICVAANRFLSDEIYLRNLKNIPGLLVGGLIVISSIFLFVGVAWYFFYTTLPPELQYLALVHFICTGIVWYVSVFLSVIGSYYIITLSFGFGFLVPLMAFLFIFPSPLPPDQFLLLTSIFGLLLTIAILLVKILAMFPRELKNPFQFLSVFRDYWEILVGGFLFSVGSWIDKWIMWFVPEAQHSTTGFYSFPVYDSAMFLANLSVIPALSMFIYLFETYLHEASRAYHRAIMNHSDYNTLEVLQQNVKKAALHSIRPILLVQITITLAFFIYVQTVFGILSLPFMGIGIFRFGLIGSFFLAFLFFTSVFLYYFNARKMILILQGTFCILNAGISLLCAQLGFNFYGYGFALSAFASFLLGIGMIWTLLSHLPYYTFIKNNDCLTRLQRNLK